MHTISSFLNKLGKRFMKLGLDWEFFSTLFIGIHIIPEHSMNPLIDTNNNYIKLKIQQLKKTTNYLHLLTSWYNLNLHFCLIFFIYNLCRACNLLSVNI